MVFSGFMSVLEGFQSFVEVRWIALFDVPQILYFFLLVDAPLLLGELASVFSWKKLLVKKEIFELGCPGLVHCSKLKELNSVFILDQEPTAAISLWLNEKPPGFSTFASNL